MVSGAPSGRSTPSGGELNLVTDYEIDDLGRHTEMLGPTHTLDLGGTATAVRSATGTVYKDGEHEAGSDEATPRGRTHPDAARWMGEVAN